MQKFILLLLLTPLACAANLEGSCEEAVVNSLRLGENLQDPIVIDKVTPAGEGCVVDLTVKRASGDTARRIARVWKDLGTEQFYAYEDKSLERSIELFTESLKTKKPASSKSTTLK